MGLFVKGIHGGFFGCDLDLVRQRERERKRGAKERGLRVREREERNAVLSIYLYKTETFEVPTIFHVNIIYENKIIKNK